MRTTGSRKTRRQHRAEVDAAALAETPEQRDARKRQTARQTKVGLSIVGGLCLFALAVGYFVPVAPSARQRAANTPNAEEQWSERLRAMVASSGHNCTAVATTFHQGMHRRSHTNYWNIRCVEGDAYAIGLKSLAAPRVVSCPSFRSIDHLDCFKNLELEKP
jgi:hypothetical protein